MRQTVKLPLFLLTCCGEHVDRVLVCAPVGLLAAWQLKFLGWSMHRRGAAKKEPGGAVLKNYLGSCSEGQLGVKQLPVSARLSSVSALLPSQLGDSEAGEVLAKLCCEAGVQNLC